MKIVINKCFGGFGLSDAAYEKLIEWGIPVRSMRMKSLIRQHIEPHGISWNPPERIKGVWDWDGEPRHDHPWIQGQVLMRKMCAETLREKLLPLVRAALAAPPQQQVDGCEGTCNPVTATCGAKFCTYEEKVYHEQRECQHVAAPRPQEDQ